MDRRHGTERALAELVERLARDYRCEIHLYAQRVEDLAFTRSTAAQHQEAGSILWHKMPSLPGPHLLQFLAWLCINSFFRFWDRWIRRIRYDLVVTLGINCFHADVVIVHALFRRLWELSRKEDLNDARVGLLRRVHRRAYYQLLAALERRMYADPRISLAAVSHRTANLLSNYFQRQDIRVIPNGVDTSGFSSSLRLARRMEARQRRNFQETDFVLLLIGNDLRVKGLETVLRAMSSLQGLPLRLIVVSSDSRRFCDEYSESLGVFDRCYFERPRIDVLDFYAASDVYVSPSREDSFGLPVLEAMACGLPIITSTFAGVADFIQSGINGFVLAEPQDALKLASLVEQLYRDPEGQQRLGEAGEQTARAYDWNRNSQETWTFLMAALEKKKKQ